MFRDPYKNINGQTVNNPTPSQPNNPGQVEHAPSIHAVPPTAYRQQNTGNSTGAIVALFVIFLVMFIVPGMVTMFLALSLTTSSVPIELGENSKYVNPNLNNVYTFTEIAKKFAFSDRSAVFTETSSIKAKEVSRSNLYLTNGQTQNDSISVSIEGYKYTVFDNLRTDCEEGTKPTAAHCEEVKNAEGFDAEKDLLFCLKRFNFEGEEDLCNYELFSPLDPDNETSDYVHILYTPLSTYRQKADVSLDILKKARATITKPDGKTPGVEEMIDRLNMPISRSGRDYLLIDFERQSYQYEDSGQMDSQTNITYEISVYSELPKVNQYSIIDSQDDPKIDVYGSSGKEVIFKIYPSASNPQFIPAYVSIRKIIHESYKPADIQYITNANQMLYIINKDNK